MVVSNWAVLAILTAVVSEKMIASSERFQEEEKEKANKQALLELFRKDDPRGTKMINKSRWREMVCDGPTRMELAEGIHLGKDDLLDLFDCLAVDDQPDSPGGSQKSQEVNYHDLVRSLKSNMEPADKRSVAHVMLRLRAMQEQLQVQISSISSKLEAVSKLDRPQQSDATFAHRGTGDKQKPSPDIKSYGDEVPDMPQSSSSQLGSQPRLIPSPRMQMRDVTSTPMSYKQESTVLQDEGVAFLPCMPVRQWTVNDVQAWAISRQVPSEVVEVLYDHAIDGLVLFTLSEHDLTTMGISKLGWRRGLIAKIREISLQDVSSSCSISMAAITSTGQGDSDRASNSSNPPSSRKAKDLSKEASSAVFGSPRGVVLPPVA